MARLERAFGYQGDAMNHIEQYDDTTWRAFHVVAPDGLRYWFGEREDAA
jgi:hypothetical protein